MLTGSGAVTGALLFFTVLTFQTFVLLSVIIVQQGNNNCVLLIVDDDYLPVLNITLWYRYGTVWYLLSFFEQCPVG